MTFCWSSLGPLLVFCWLSGAQGVRWRSSGAPLGSLWGSSGGPLGVLWGSSGGPKALPSRFHRFDEFVDSEANFKIENNDVGTGLGSRHTIEMRGQATEQRHVRTDLLSAPSSHPPPPKSLTGVL